MILLLAASAAMASPWEYHFDGPLPQWKNGLPVGNGRIGAQIWGTGPALFITLDRGDVWDLRYEENHSPTYNWKRLRELVRQGDQGEIQKEMPADVSPTNELTPTRVSIGRLRLDLPAATLVEAAELDMRRAEVRLRLLVNGQKAHYQAVACADPNVILITLDGAKGWSPNVRLEALGELNAKVAARLGYPRAVEGGEGDYAWARQRIGTSGTVTVVWTAWRQGDTWALLLTIPRQDDAEAFETGRSTLKHARALGIERLLQDHHEWWARRWTRSSVAIPDPELQRLWINGLYKLASSSYLGVPTNLQGLWPPDGEIPPWRGDYHFDMNVQVTYWPAYSSNQLDLVEPLNRWLFEHVAPVSEELTRRFFGVDGLWIGGAVDVKGRLLGCERACWDTVQYWLGSGAWLAQHVWWYYSYGQDREYLRTQGYSFLKKAARFFENILEQGPDGKLHVPLSASPEYNGNDLKAWTPDPTCDLSLVRGLLQYAREAASTLGVDADKQELWLSLEKRLAPYPVGSGGLKVAPNSDYSHSHVLPMHLFPIFPGGDLNVEGSAEDRELIDRSLNELVIQGTGGWNGYSFPYGSLIAARARRANHALQLLEAYRDAYVWPNGFHINGDYKRTGRSYYDEVFTVEAECGFTAAVNEMLLQGWGGRLRIFPSVPEKWRDVSFQNLRAEGGYLVSAEMRRGEVVSATVEAEKGGEVEVLWPGGQAVVKLAPGERRELPVP